MRSVATEGAGRGRNERPAARAPAAVHGGGRDGGLRVSERRLPSWRRTFDAARLAVYAASFFL